MKKVLSITLALVMAISCFAGFGTEAFAAKNGWKAETESVWDEATEDYVDVTVYRYYKNDAYVTGWQKISNNWYYFDEAGVNLRDMGFWDLETDDFYWFDSKGLMKKGWFKQHVKDSYISDSGKTIEYEFTSWFYFGTNGKAYRGWQKIGGVWYCFDKELAYMYYNEAAPVGNDWYCFQSSGAMATGWFNDKGSYYDENDDVIKYNYWYYCASSGKALKGWQKISGVWYYFNKNAIMQTGWQKISGAWYYFSGGGAMKTGWQKIGGKWYYFNASGTMKTGWLKSGGKWYYFNSSGAMLANTSQKIGGKTYRFNASGVCTNP